MDNKRIDGVQVAVSRLEDALDGLNGLMDLLSAASSARVGADGVRTILEPMVGEIREAREELQMLL